MNKLNIPNVIMDYIVDDYKKVSWDKEGNQIKKKNLYNNIFRF